MVFQRLGSVLGLGKFISRAFTESFAARSYASSGREQAWPIEAVGSRLGWDSSTNIVFPDKAANYWMTPIFFDADTELVIDGQWPQARYFSFQTYTPRDRFSAATDGIRDSEITADADGAYRLRVVPTRSDKPDDATNTIVALQDGRAGGVCWLAFRTYKPDDQAQPAGSVPLPTLTLERGDAPPRILDFAGTDTPAGGEGIADESQTSGRSLPMARKRALGWNRPGGDKTPFPNKDAAYLASIICYEPGQVVVVRGLAPTYPSDAMPAEKADVKYWSVCKFGLPSTKTISCGSDDEVPLDGEGRYTFVVSDPRDRPANATLADGVFWLPWGPEPTGVVGLRNIAPSDDFYPKSVQAIGPGDAVEDVLAEFCPGITQCTTEQFEAGGADGVFGR